ncbi:MAG: NUDIX domain-containing protein [Gammaproteobacteria bacterium]|nr:NUDIX domain-containing protein [Gammaproteobacteria bacterium]
MKYEIEVLEVKTAYDGFLGLKQFRFRHSLFAGGMSPPILRERIESYRAASVILYDPILDQVVLIEQFRIAGLEDNQGAWTLEIVGGVIDNDEAPEQVARREAREEADCEIGELEFICEFLVSPGYSTERIHLFCGQVDSSVAGGIHGVRQEGEDIRVSVLPVQELMKELYHGRVNSTSTIIATQWLAANRERLQNQWRPD